MRLAVFVSEHGYGHSARCCAALEALAAAGAVERAEIFTAAPRWIFEESLGPTPVEWTLHEHRVDVGLVQRTSVEEDLPATVAALQSFYPPSDEAVGALAASVRELGCDALLADISPLGLSVAERAGIPGVLLENFTWDWIYAAYLDDEPGLAAVARWCAGAFGRASLHLQTEPVCRRDSGARRVGPLARRPRCTGAETRHRLGLGEDRPLVLLSMGGVPWRYGFLERLGGAGDVDFVVAGPVDEAADTAPRNVRTLDRFGAVYHPDLVAAADLMVGKLGYSTVAEALQSRTALLWVDRPRFPETAVIANYLDRVGLPNRRVSLARFAGGDWLPDARALLEASPPVEAPASGAAALVEALGGLG